MVDELEELALHISNLIPLFRCFGVTDVLNTCMQNVLNLPQDLSFSDMVFYFYCLLNIR